MSCKELVLEYGMPRSQSIRTLDEYRQAIYQAENSHDLELLIYRALPVLYADMGMAYSKDSPVSVATKLYRNEDTWELWFNISIPKAIDALGHLAPNIFNRMSGGTNQASAITRNAYGQGFLKSTQPFVVEPVFVQQQERLGARLNQATSLQTWWAAFYEELPWSLARARGWEAPSKKQWMVATQKVAEFQQQYGASLESAFLLDGKILSDGSVQVKPRVRSTLSDFSNRIDRKFYPLFNHCPGMTLDSGAVHSFNIKTLELIEKSESICARAKPIVCAHCAIADTRSMPTYLLVQAVQHELAPEMGMQLPEGTEMASPTPF